MKMIDILKRELKEGMTIENDRELSDKYKLVIVYDGMKAPVVLSKTCAPECEKEVCRKAIDTALSTMYVNVGNLAEAKKWLNGEFWTDSEIRTVKDFGINATGGYNIYYSNGIVSTVDKKTLIEMLNGTIK